MQNSDAVILRTLIQQQPIATLATLHGGEPAASMVPFVLAPGGAGFVIHISRLASHSHDIQAHPAVALLITAPLEQASTPLALPRVSVQAVAQLCAVDSLDYAPARSAYLTRFPEAEELFSFSDFALFSIAPTSARFIAGFGRAMTLSPKQLQEVVSAQ